MRGLRLQLARGFDNFAMQAQDSSMDPQSGGQKNKDIDEGRALNQGKRGHGKGDEKEKGLAVAEGAHSEEKKSTRGRKRKR